jgi:hypothetical protein
MRRNIVIEHKEVAIVCEESRLVSLNYSVILTTPKTIIIVKHVVFVLKLKSTLTCTNCGKAGHLVKTFYNMKKEVLLVPTTIVKYIKPIAGTKTQLVKSGKILVYYPCII